MLFTRKWMEQFIDLEGITDQEIADKLTSVGLEIENLFPIGLDPKNKGQIILVQAEKVEQHPNADKLKKVTLKAGKEVFHVVTNSQTISEKDHAVYAKTGTILPTGEEVGDIVLRGEASSGMLLAKQRFNLEKKSNDLWLLSKDHKKAKEEFDIMSAPDTLFEVDLTANRGDCLSILGIARELSAVLDKPLKEKEIEIPVSLDNEIEIENLDKKDCPRYSACLLKNVKIVPSPFIIQKFLSSCGIRPINNIVDATNISLMELGQPAHAYDFSQIEGSKIEIKKLKEGTKFETLDHQEHTLDGTELMICDSKKPLAFAGVMGGVESEVVPETSDILLESAFFDPSSIRRTSRIHKTKSEASYRFERATDILQTSYALDRICEIILETSKAKISNKVDLIQDNNKFFKKKVVVLKTAYTNQILGMKLTTDQIYTLLEKLHFNITAKRDTELEVLIPSYRTDVYRAIDLVEEVLRMYGYQNVESKEYHIASFTLSKNLIEDKLRKYLANRGFIEVRNFSFMNDETLEKHHLDITKINRETISLKNPLGQDTATLRTFLLPNILKNLESNKKVVRNTSFAFFEIGHIFFKKEDKIKEREHLAIVIAGDKLSYDRAFAKVLNLFEEMNCDKYSLSDSSIGIVHPKNSIAILKKDTPYGFFGELHPEICEMYDAKNIWIMEIDTSFFDVKEATLVKPLPKYPSSVRDLSLVVDENVLAFHIMKTIQNVSPLISKVEFISLYKDDSLGKDKKSLNFSLEFQKEDSTFKDEEVESLMKAILAETEKIHHAVLR